MSSERDRSDDNPKSYILHVRMDEDTLKKLDECAAILKTSRSQAVRIAIYYLGEHNLNETNLGEVK